MKGWKELKARGADDVILEALIKLQTTYQSDRKNQLIEDIKEYIRDKR